jgi:putative membrane protein
MNMMGNWGEFGGWGMGFGFLLMILFWLLIVVGVVVLIRWLLLQSRAGRDLGAEERPRARTALEILQERYARGEIERDEFEQKKRDLSS